jgi:RNA polymerase sigma factor (sigma-70 family)
MPWLLLIARRLIIDHERRRRLVAWVPLGFARQHEMDDRSANESEALIWFAQLRRAMTPRQYEALVLRYLFDLADEEIGRLMGLSASGVRTLASRGIAALRGHPEVLET